MYQTSFQPGQMNVDELKTLAEWLTKKTGAPVVVELVIVVSTESAEVSNMLDSLRDSIKNGRQPKMERKNGHKPKAELRRMKAEAMGRASRKIEQTGEIMSLVELKKRMAAGEIENGCVILNHKGERFVVMDSELIEEPKS